jgi:hypothetical protein
VGHLHAPHWGAPYTGDLDHRRAPPCGC